MNARLWARPFLIWLGACALLASAGAGSFFLAREIAGDEPEAGADLGPGWFVPALQEDAKKPRITRQVVDGILVGPESDLAPTIDLCQEDPDGASPVASDEVDLRSAGTPVEVSPSYLPDGLAVESGEANECSGTIVNVVKRYAVATRKDPNGGFAPLWSGGAFFISRSLTSDRQYPLEGAAERLRSTTIAGHDAVVVEPVKPLGFDIGVAPTTIVIADDSGITVIQGDGMPFEEFMKLAASLYAG